MQRAQHRSTVKLAPWIHGAWGILPTEQPRAWLYTVTPQASELVHLRIRLFRAGTDPCPNTIAKSSALAIKGYEDQSQPPSLDQRAEY